MGKYTVDQAIIELEKCFPEKELVQEIVRAAVESGTDIVLEYLRSRGLWHPQGGGSAIEAAAEAGTLLGLLAQFPLPLARYPSVAGSHLMEAVSVFDRINQQHLHRHKRKDGRKASCSGVHHDNDRGTADSNHPDPTISVTRMPPLLATGREHVEDDNFRDLNTAQLLANFLSVPSKVAEEAMNHVVEAMVVFIPRECRWPNENFSSEIPPLYLHQEDVEAQWVLHRSEQSGWMVLPLPIHKVCPGTDILLKLSNLYPLQLSLRAKKELGISIPKKAKNFAFVKPGEGVRHPLGGLAFFDKKNRLTSWVSLSLDRELSNKNKAKVALQFLACDDPLESDPQLDSLEKYDWQAVHGWKPEAEHFKLLRADKFAWVGPSDLMQGHHLESVIGGFMFFVDGKASYLRIGGAGQADELKKLVLRSQVDNLTTDSKFPECLGTLFLDRRITCTSQKEATDKGLRFLPPGAMSDGTQDPNGTEGAMSGRLTVGKQELLCSSVFKVTMKENDRRAVLIPSKATHFACIYPGKGAPDGGFVYLLQVEGQPPPLLGGSALSTPAPKTAAAGSEGQKDANHSFMVLAINVHVNQGRHALSFGSMKLLGTEESKNLKEQFTMQPISLDTLLEAGATHYCFVGAAVKFSATLESGPRGGFAYIFDKPEDNRFFPIKGSGEVLDRAVLYGEMNTLVVPGPDSNADSSLICNSLRNPSGKFHKICSRLCPEWFKEPCEMHVSEGKANLVPVQVARLKICDALNPTVLHALACTPRPQVLHTIAAKAIAQAAFDRAWPGILVDTFLEAMSLAGITAVSVVVRYSDNGDAQGQDFSAHYAVLSCAFVFMVFVWSKNIFTEILLCSGYWRRSWTWDYLDTIRFVLWLHLALMFRLQLWLGHGWLYGIWSDPRQIRPLLAAVGCMKWIRLLYMLRGFESWSFGKRILPIMTSLLEVSTFFIIMFFMLGAYTIAAYSISTKDVSLLQVILSAYRLNFLSDFDMDADVYFKTDANDQQRPREWEWLQLVVFVVASFVITISMMNIYIGVMSNAFDHHTDCVVELFVRARADMGLDHALRIEALNRWYNFCGRCCRRHKGTTAYDHDDRERLWICHPHLEQNELEVTTLRGAMKTLSVGMKAQVGILSDGVGELKLQLGSLSNGVGELKLQLKEMEAKVPKQALEVDSLSDGAGDLNLRLTELEATVLKQAACTNKDCGSRLQPDAKFCCQCRKIVQVHCMCGAQLLPGVKFCLRCGDSLASRQLRSAESIPATSAPGPSSCSRGVDSDGQGVGLDVSSGQLSDKMLS